MKKEDIFNPEIEIEEQDENFDNKSDYEKNRTEKIKELKGFYLKNLSEYFDIPKYRLKWDKGIKTKQNMGNLECETENVQVKINYTIFKSPLPFVDDRSIIDKNISFYYNNDYYIFCSSIDKKLGLEICPIGEEDKNVRAWSILNLAKYSEDADNIYITCYYQVDYDVVLSDAILQPLTAATIPSFYKKFNRFVKENILELKKK